jgi:hypothetical protein
MPDAKIPARYIPGGSITVRDKASTAVAYVRDVATGGFSAICYSGRRAKPDSRYRYRTAAARQAAVINHFETVRATEKYRTERREAQKTARNGDATAKDYLTCAETAALIRRALAESFIAARFSVRSDSNAVRVAWTDGPSTVDVDRIANSFCGGYFDGMNDFAGSLYHLLDGRRVHFGARYVFTSRTVSAEAMRAGIAALVAARPGERVALQVEATQWGERRKVIVDGEDDFSGNPMLGNPEGRWIRAALALEHWHDQANPVPPVHSATLARVQFLGSDYSYYSGIPTAAEALARLGEAAPTAH